MRMIRCARSRSIFLILAALLLSMQSALAAMPDTVRLSARILEEDGDEAFSYEGPITVRLIDAEDDSAELWSEIFENVAVEGGWFSIELGTSGTETPDALAVVLAEQTGTELYLEVSLEDEDGEPYVLPTQLKLTSVPYALQAANADLLEGHSAADFAEAEHTHDWEDIANVPDTVLNDQDTTYSARAGMGLEFDGETIGLVTSCNAGEGLLWNGSNWECSVVGGSADTLADLTCADGEVTKWNQNDSRWECAPDEVGASGDSLIAGNDSGLQIEGSDISLTMACTEGQILRRNADGWTCSDEETVNTDTLADLGCTENQVPKFVGGVWVCEEDLDTDTNTDALADLACTDGQIPKMVGGVWTCEADLDTDTDSFAALTCLDNQILKYDTDHWICAEDVVGSPGATYSAKVNMGLEFDGTEIGLLSGCMDGEILKWNQAFGAWECQPDVDTDTDSLAALTCSEGQVLKWVAGMWLCEADENTDALGTLSCSENQIAKLVGGVWRCEEDLDTDTDSFAALNCLDNQVLKFNTDHWECAEDVVGSPGETYSAKVNMGLEFDGTEIGLLSGCMDGEVLKWNQASGAWECQPDVDTDTDTDSFAALSCLDNQVLKYDTDHWICAEDVVGSPGETYSAKVNMGLEFDGTEIGLLSGCMDGEILKWNQASGAWECRPDVDTIYTAGTGISITTGVITNTGDPDGSDDLLVSTSFAGDVTGTYDNLQLGTGVVGVDELGSNSVNTLKVESNTLLFEDLADNGCMDGQIIRRGTSEWMCSNESDALVNLGCSNGQIPKHDGSGFSCGDDADTLSHLGCLDGQIARRGASTWMCAEETDPLGDLGCSNGDIIKHDGNGFLCSVDEDTMSKLGCLDGQIARWNEVSSIWTCEETDLRSLPCSTSQVAKFNGATWECGDDLNDDTLMALGCAEGEIPKISAGLWACDTDLNGDTLAALSCTEGAVVKYSGGVWHCDLDQDSDTLASLSCGEGYIPKFVSGVWGCDMDTDSDTLAGLSCSNGEIPKYSIGMGWNCEADQDSDTLASLSCGEGYIPKFVSGVWSCEMDTDSDTLAGLSCSEGEIPKYSIGTGWNCEPDQNTDTLAGISCGSGAILSHDGNGWVCGTDQDSDTLASLSCGEGYIPKFVSGVWGCDMDTDSDTLAGLSCSNGEIPKYSIGMGWNCEADQDSDTLASLSCGEGYIPKFVSGVWSCEMDTDSDTLVTLGCDEGEVPLYSSGTWICDLNTDEDSLGALSCSGDQIPRYNGSSWECSNDKEGEGILPHQVPGVNEVTVLYTGGHQKSKITIGSDGLPVILAYKQTVTTRLRLVKCNDMNCTTFTSTGIAADIAPDAMDLAIGADGLPIVAYRTDDVYVIKCTDMTCENHTDSSVGHIGGLLDNWPNLSMAIGIDGLPIISYSSNQQYVVHCTDMACLTGISVEVWDGTFCFATDGSSTISIGMDGLPIIAFQADEGGYIMAIYHCEDVICSTFYDRQYGTTMLVTSISSTISKDGYPIMAFVPETNNATVMMCQDALCEGAKITTEVGSDQLTETDTAIAYGSNGNPVVVYHDSDNDLGFIACQSADCSSFSRRKLDTVGSTGYYPAVTVRPDGRPIITYYDETTSSLKVMSCANAQCLPFWSRR